jgi:hypothetical protein
MGDTPGSASRPMRERWPASATCSPQREHRARSMIGAAERRGGDDFERKVIAPAHAVTPRP